jgi:hypothetical protein
MTRAVPSVKAAARARAGLTCGCGGPFRPRGAKVAAPGGRLRLALPACAPLAAGPGVKVAGIARRLPRAPDPRLAGADMLAACARPRSAQDR